MGGSLLAVIRLPGTLYRHRFLLWQLAWRAFGARHAGSFLGWLWTPLATTVQFVLYMVVFSAILEIKVEGLGIDVARRPAVGFGVFLITGLVPFLALNDAVLRGARAFRAHASLVQRVRMPVELLVLGDVLGVLMHHAISFALVIAYCLWRGHLTLAGLPWVVAALVLLLLWIVGLALCVSLVGAFLPDVAEFLGLALQVLFYAAPIVYPLSLVRSVAVRTAIEANPVTPLLGVFRAGLLGAEAPSLMALCYLMAGAVTVSVAGAAMISRWRGSIPDVV